MAPGDTTVGRRPAQSRSRQSAFLVWSLADAQSAANTADPRGGSTRLHRSRRAWHVGQPEGCSVPAEKAGEHAAEGAKDMKSAVSAKAEEIRTAAQTKAETLGKQLEEYVRGDPIKAILIAAGVGLGVGS